MINSVDTLSVDTAVVKQSIATKDTLQLLGVLPESFPDAVNAAPDTLTKLQLVPFVSTDKIQLTRYHSMREFAPGFEGKPLVKDPCSSDLMASIVLVCVLSALFILSRAHKYIYQRMHDFFVLHEPARKFLIETVGDARSTGFFFLQTSIFSGIVFFSYFIHTSQLTHHVSPYVLFGIYVVSCIIYFFFKWCAYSFLGWIFFNKKQIDIFIESYFTLICYMGFILFPVVLMIVFSHLNPDILMIVGLCLVILAKILMFYKWIKLFSKKFVQLVFLILYFCALEIIPCFLFFQGMVYMNNMLIKNF